MTHRALWTNHSLRNERYKASFVRTDMTVVEPDPVVRLREQMREGHLAPLWELEGEIMGLRPNPTTRPWLWRWSELYPIAEAPERADPLAWLLDVDHL